MFYVEFPWMTIILGILMWSMTAFVVTLIIKFVINMLPSDTIDQMMEEQESEFLSFTLKKRELDSMLENIQAARAEMEIISDKIDEVLYGGYKDEDTDE